MFKSKEEWRLEFKSLSDKAIADKMEVAKSNIVTWKKELDEAIENAGGLISSLFGSPSLEDQNRIDKARLSLKGWEEIRDAAKAELKARGESRPAQVEEAKEEAIVEAFERAQTYYEDKKEIEERGGEMPVEDSGFLATIARGPTAIAAWFGLGGGDQEWEDRLSGLIRLGALAALVIGGAFALQSLASSVFGAAGGAAQFVADQSGKNVERVAGLATKIPGGMKW